MIGNDDHPRTSKQREDYQFITTAELFKRKHSQSANIDNNGPENQYQSELASLEDSHQTALRMMQAKIGILKELLNNFENISNADKKHRVKVVNAIKQQLGGAHVSSIDEEVKRMVVQFYLELEKETKNLKESQKQEEYALERDEQLIKFSYKFLKFASTVENYTNGAAQCSKLLPVGHEFEKLKAKVLRRVAPYYFEDPECPFAALNVLEIYWIHNDLLMQNFQTKLAKNPTRRVEDMFSVAHRRMLKYVVLNGFGGTLSNSDISLLFDDFWSLGRGTNSSFHQLLTNEDPPKFPAIFSYHSTLESEKVITSSKKSSSSLRFLLLCKVLATEDMGDIRKGDEYSISNADLIMPEYLIVYEFTPKTQSSLIPTSVLQKRRAAIAKTILNQYSQNVDNAEIMLESNKILQHQADVKTNIKEELARRQVDLWREQKVTKHLQRAYKVP